VGVARVCTWENIVGYINKEFKYKNQLPLRKYKYGLDSLLLLLRQGLLSKCFNVFGNFFLLIVISNVTENSNSYVTH
jgi:hypothetical protein